MRPVSFLLAFVLSLTITTSVDSKSNPLQSIRPFQVITTNNETGEESFDDICTAWSTMIDGRSYWTTAMHCIKLGEDGFPDLKERYFVDGKSVTFKHGSFENDVALLLGGPSVAPLPVSFMAPKVGQKVWTAGYPMDEGLVMASGIVMSIDMKIHHLVFYELPAGPGVSGAPILNEDNTVVGIAQMMGCPYIVGYCPVSMGVSLERLQATLQAVKRDNLERAGQ